MKSKTISNSKVKNTGVLFELLVRQITAETLAGKQTSPALDIMKKFFNSSTELGKELQLYRAFLETPKSLTETKALDYVDLVVAQRKNLDERKLANEKYNLVKEIKDCYNLKDFLGCKIPNYTMLASIYKTFVNEIVKDKSFTILNIQDVATARFSIVEHLLKVQNVKKSDDSKNILLEEYRRESEELRLLAYKLAVDKFNDRYDNLNVKQKSLLREYINNVATENTFYEYISNEIPKLKGALIKKASNIQEKVLSIKLLEVANQLDTIGKVKEIKDNEVAALMIAYEILKEIQ